ncbi:MAG: sensor histidine kinase, partial [Cytophagaceae bacterium]
MPLNDTIVTASANAPRRSLALIAIAATIPIVLFTAWVVFIDAKQQRSDARLFAQRTINRVVTRINNELNVQVEVAEILAASPSLDTGDLTQFYTEAARISSARPLWETVALVDSSGQQLANLFKPLGSELGKTSDRPNFDKVLETQ